MEMFETLGVKIPNAVLVDGATDSELRDDILAFLESFGDIGQHVTIDDKDSEFTDRFVVEFKSGSALALLPNLPYTHVSEDGNKFFIENLSEVYAAKGCASKTENFMKEVKNIAKLSGKEYGEILQEMMSQINKSITELSRAGAVTDPDRREVALRVDIKQSESPSVHAAAVPPTSSSDPPETAPRDARRSPINMAAGDLNPPEVQRYVVEHVVRSGDGSHSSHRLRTFSGKVPRPAHETDYDTWRSGVELILRDPSISDLQRTRLVRDSLLPPAAEIVKHFRPDTLPGVLLEQLESAYGTVQDGDELYAKFLDTYQDAGEKPSTYLQRLQVALQHAVRRGGVPARDVNKRLLTQFCRGCWDNNLIVELQLKQRKNDPPPFAELLLLLRTEEDQDATKTIRMKQHLGTVKQKVSSHAQFVSQEEEANLCATLTSFAKQLTDQMTAIQKQLGALSASQASHKPPLAMKSEGSGTRSTTKSPKPGFCFRCGEDGHIKPQCVSEPNSSLVAAKRKQFQEKQQKLKKQSPDSTGNLN